MARLPYKSDPEAVIDKLIDLHGIEAIKAIVHRKARRKARRGNNFVEIAIATYIHRLQNDSKWDWTDDKIAEAKNISPKTIKNHRYRFRKMIEERFEQVKADPYNYTLPEYMDLDTFLDGYIKYLVKNDLSDKVKRKEDFEQTFHDYIEENFYR